MAARKTKAAPRRRPPQQVEVSLTSVAGQKLKPYATLAASVTAVIGVFVLIWTGWVTVGGPTPVFTGKLDEFKGEVSRQISATKVEVVGHSDKNTADVKRDVSAVSGSIEKLSRTVIRSQIENLEAQEASLVWSQRPQLIVSLASIEKQLQERPGDQWLIQRKGEVANAMETLDKRIADTRERLRKLKEQM